MMLWKVAPYNTSPRHTFIFRKFDASLSNSIYMPSWLLILQWFEPDSGQLKTASFSTKKVAKNKPLRSIFSHCPVKYQCFIKLLSKSTCLFVSHSLIVVLDSHFTMHNINFL
jgi:hypothetical protein